jgi:2-desacetyl-2-hydroxyethyl bacteriochlorophyllide A dehydrogenase
MRALRFTAPGAASVVETEPPAAAAGEAIVAPRFVGLCGTDLELLTGAMPYFAAGLASYPIQPGHEVSGTVVEGGGLPPGTAVMIDPVFGCGACAACAAGFATRCADRRELGLRRGMPGGACELIAVPAANLHPVPDGVALRDATLVEPGVTALNAVDRIGDVAGGPVAVVGAGTLGLLAAQLLLARGAEVDVVVVEPERTALVERIGARPVPSAAPERYAAAIEAAGTPAAVHAALAAVAPGGRIAVVGVQPGPVDGVDLNALVLKDASLHGVLNGPGLYDRLLGELAAGGFDASALIDVEFELGEARAALERLQEPGRAAPKIVLRVGA